MNVTIHHQWASLFASHMNSESQNPTDNNASFDNSNFDNEKIHCTPIDSMINIFSNVPKIMNHENTMYFIAPNKNFTF